MDQPGESKPIAASGQVQETKVLKEMEGEKDRVGFTTITLMLFH